MTMPPKLVIDLCERVPNGFRKFGLYDMTAPAALSIMEGGFDAWRSGPIPATASVCRHIDHEARLAVWGGRLFSWDLPYQAEPFEKAVIRFGGAERLLEYLVAKQEARAIRQHAEALLDDVETTRFVNPGRLDLVSHPLTGEISDQGDLSHGSVPFAFGTVEEPWSGVDPDELHDFVFESGADLPASRFPSDGLPYPSPIVADLHELDMAIDILRKGGSYSSYRRAVMAWNAKYEGHVAANDARFAVSFRGNREDAIKWCRSYLRSAEDLEQSLEELYANPSVG